MNDVNTQVSVGFPPENVSPEQKQKKEWGLQAGKAVWFHNHAYSPDLFYNNRDTYDELIRFAFGEQSEDRVKPGLGVNPTSQEKSFVGGISWKTKKFAIKRVMSTVSRIFAKRYDPVATAIDPTSSDRKESFKASLKSWIDQQEWLTERQKMSGVDMMPEGMDMSSLPINDEDLQIYMQNDYKLNEEIMLELGITLHLRRLNFDAIKEKADFYLTVLPVAGIRVGLDSDNLPTAKILNSGRILAPRSEFNDFKRLAYAGDVDEYTVAEFRKMVGGEWDKEKIDLIINQFSKRGNYTANSYSSEYPDTDKDVDKIRVLYFEVAQTDELTYLEKKDGDGNQRFTEKPYEYYRGTKNKKTGALTNTPEEFNKRYGKTRTIHRIPKRTTYGGYWVVGSEEVFGYGEKNFLKGELGYILRASNMIDGHSTSMVKQMIPCIDNIERYDKKIQQLVASALPGQLIEINLAALRNASFKFGDKDMGTADLIELAFKQGIIVTDTKDFGNGSTAPTVVIHKVGISDDLAKYIELMRFELEQLDEIIGYNSVSSASTLSPETGARVAQQMDMATDTALDHLYRADRGLCHDVFKALGHLHTVSVQRNPNYYVPILGQEAVSRILMSSSYVEQGIDIEARPTQQEWNQFYVEIDSLVKEGKIEPEDKVALRRFQSLKQAYSYLRVLTRKRKNEAQQNQLQLVQANAEAQQQSNQQSFQNNSMLEDKKIQGLVTVKQLDLQLEKVKHENLMAQIALQQGLVNQGKLQEAEIDGEYGIKETVLRNKKPVSN